MIFHRIQNEIANDQYLLKWIFFSSCVRRWNLLWHEYFVLKCHLAASGRIERWCLRVQFDIRFKWYSVKNAEVSSEFQYDKALIYVTELTSYFQYILLGQYI